jgi:protein-tyrosine phosphatase
MTLARDLGGIAVAGGGRIRERALIRTDNHDRLDAAGLAAIQAYGANRIVDLRWQWEATKYPSPLATDERYRLVPACDPAGDEAMPSDGYRLMMDTSGKNMVAALTAIAEAPPGGVVVHCHAGRDRTGVVVALALHLAGASTESIAADYMLTENCPPAAIVNTIAHLTSAYGSVGNYLLGSGMTPTQIAALRSRLVQESE